MAKAQDQKYASAISNEFEESAKKRGTGIAKRSSDYISRKMKSGNAIIAFVDNQLAGFSYMEIYDDGEFVTNSGLIVFPKYRKMGIARKIKNKIFKLSREKFKNAKIVSITTSSAVMKLNNELGFEPITFDNLPVSKTFWNGCKSCENYDILNRKNKKMCLCTGLLFEPNGKNKEKENMRTRKVVIAYSGGLDTSYCLVRYAQDEKMNVHTVIVNTGGFSDDELKEIEKRAYQLGSQKHVSIQVIEKFYQKCIRYLIFGNTLKNNTYPLSVSAERIFQAMAIAEYAEKENAECIIHGSTGAGNDQIRFDVAFSVISPKAKIITPIRDEKLSRLEEINYLKSKGINLDWEKAKYSINKGIWGTSVGGAETLTSSDSLPEEAYPSQATQKEPKTIKIEFLKGEPVGLDGKTMKPTQVIQSLNKLASSFGIGRGIHVGDTIVGIKGRVGFEAAAPIILIKAHHLLEKHTLSKWQLLHKDQIGNWYGTLLHEAQYLDPIMRDFETFLESSQRRVTGTVSVLLNPYRFELIGIDSPFDMMQSKKATYGEENQAWDASDAKGFTKIYGNQLSIYHSIKDKEESKK